MRSKRRDRACRWIIFSGHGNIDTAVAAVGRGAMDFIEKPFEAERLLLLVERATGDRAAAAREFAPARGQLGQRRIHRQFARAINAVPRHA